MCPPQQLCASPLFLLWLCCHLFAFETIQIVLIWWERLHCEFHWKTSHSLWESIKCSAWTILQWFSDLFKNRRDFIFSDLAGIILCVTHNISRTKSFNLLRKGYFILSRNVSADSRVQEVFRFSFIIICVPGNTLAKSTFELCCAINLWKHFECTLKSTESPI